jgi:hypothetical protein
MKPDRPPTDELIQFLSEYDIRVGELALALRDIVLGETPTIPEIVHRSYALSMTYSFTGRWPDGFCLIVVSRNHVNLGFFQGAQLDDPYNVLEGSGKQMRHIKIRKPDDLKRPYLRSYIRAAMKQNKADLKEKELARASRSKLKTRSKKGKTA